VGVSQEGVRRSVGPPGRAGDHELGLGAVSRAGCESMAMGVDTMVLVVFGMRMRHRWLVYEVVSGRLL
jgi:hypothetical protein